MLLRNTHGINHVLLVSGWYRSTKIALVRFLAQLPRGLDLDQIDLAVPGIEWQLLGKRKESFRHDPVAIEWQKGKEKGNYR